LVPPPPPPGAWGGGQHLISVNVCTNKNEQQQNSQKSIGKSKPAYAFFLISRKILQTKSIETFAKSL
jgi:hypothetical protein